LRLTLVDVELPNGHRFEHHVVRSTAEAAAVVVHDPARGVLLLWRHRFVTDTWGWETPAGRIDAGETPEAAGARETFEETGWRPGPLRRIGSFNPMNGQADQRFWVFATNTADEVGPPSDPAEADRVEWVPIAALRAAIGAGQVPDGLSLTALLWALGPALYR
jgi:8-oxo-dGTP pyrophosphatase MutT (NUDIX family)